MAGIMRLLAKYETAEVSVVVQRVASGRTRETSCPRNSPRLHEHREVAAAGAFCGAWMPVTNDRARLVGVVKSSARR
jgi:hypothetical protein